MDSQSERPMTSTSDEELVVSSALPVSDPLLRAYHTYRETRDYKNTRKWALTDEHVDGSLWAAFMHGWEANDATTSSSHDSLVKALEFARKRIADDIDVMNTISDTFVVHGKSDTSKIRAARSTQDQVDRETMNIIDAALSQAKGGK